MSKTLLEKSRAINHMLQKNGGNPVDYYGICTVLSEILSCSVFMVGRRGHLLGFAFSGNEPCNSIEQLINHTERFPENFNQEFVGIEETEVNIHLKEGRRCIFNFNSPRCNCGGQLWTIVPVFSGIGRVGTLVLTRRGPQFGDEDIVLAEYGAMAVANEIMRNRAERIEEEVREKASVKIALAALSYSEKDAINHIMAELNGSEGVLVASRIADKAGITRSVIVSALRKFESAGVIESRSLGMKGTYIKVLNDHLIDELCK